MERLEGWHVGLYFDPFERFQMPQLKKRIVVGKLPDGRRIATNFLTELNLKTHRAVTVEGEVFELGDPCSYFLHWIGEHRVKFEDYEMVPETNGVACTG